MSAPRVGRLIRIFQGELDEEHAPRAQGAASRLTWSMNLRPTTVNLPSDGHVY